MISRVTTSIYHRFAAKASKVRRYFYQLYSHAITGDSRRSLSD